MSFDGGTFNEGRDGGRLHRQLDAVYNLMFDNQWRTLQDIVDALDAIDEIKASMPAVSARLRDLRKSKFGGHTVERQYISNGLWRYRLIVRSQAESAA